MDFSAVLQHIFLNIHALPNKSFILQCWIFFRRDLKSGSVSIAFLYTPIKKSSNTSIVQVIIGQSKYTLSSMLNLSPQTVRLKSLLLVNICV